MASLQDALARDTVTQADLASATAIAPVVRVDVSTTAAKAVVTGGTGFIGRRLLARLAQDGAVQATATVRRQSAVDDLKRLGLSARIASLDDVDSLIQAFEGADVVYHLAAEVVAIDEAAAKRVNEIGTRNVAEACARQARPPRLVYVSSVAAAGPCARGGVRMEADDPAPVSCYGRTKLGGEREAARFADRVPITIIRPGIVFGPGNREMVAMFRTIRWLCIHPTVGLWTPPLSLIYVDDLLDILLAAGERGERLSPDGTAGHGVYFAADAEFLDYSQLGRICMPALGRPFAFVYPVAWRLAWLVAWTNELLGRMRGTGPGLFNRDKIREAIASSWACSGEKARRQFGLSPSRSVQDRMTETIAWCVREKWL